MDIFIAGRLDPRTVLMLVALSLTLAACVAFMLFGWFSHMLSELRHKMGKVKYLRATMINLLGI